MLGWCILNIDQSTTTTMTRPMQDNDNDYRSIVNARPTETLLPQTIGRNLENSDSESDVDLINTTVDVTIRDEVADD